MHVPTHSFSSVGDNLEDITKRVIDALFHVRDTEGASAILVSIYLPEAQCHLLLELDAEEPYRSDLTVATQTPEETRVTTEVDATDYDEAVRYVVHILSEFDDQRQVSNVVVTTDGRRVQDVTSLLRNPPS